MQPLPLRDARRSSQHRPLRGDCQRRSSLVARLVAPCLVRRRPRLAACEQRRKHTRGGRARTVCGGGGGNGGDSGSGSVCQARPRIHLVHMVPAHARAAAAPAAPARCARGGWWPQPRRPAPKPSHAQSRSACHQRWTVELAAARVHLRRERVLQRGRVVVQRGAGEAQHRQA